MPSYEDQPELFELVKTYQLHRHSKTCRKYRNTACRFNFGKLFSEKTIISEPLSESIPSERRKQILSEKNEIITKVKSYINEHLNPSKKNFFDPVSENYVAPPSIDEILNSLEISKSNIWPSGLKFKLA